MRVCNVQIEVHKQFVACELPFQHTGPHIVTYSRKRGVRYSNRVLLWWSSSAPVNAAELRRVTADIEDWPAPGADSHKTGA